MYNCRTMENLPIVRNLSKRQYEVLSYLFFGGLTTLVNLVVYILFVQFIGLSIAVSNVIALIVSILFAFVTNKLWVFRSKSWEKKLLAGEAAKFFTARAITGAIDALGVPLLYYAGLTYALFGVEGFAAKAIVMVVVIVLNYVLSKLVVFNKR